MMLAKSMIDNSALQELWTGALEDGEADFSHAPDQSVSSDGMPQRPPETTAGHQDTRVGV